MNYYVYYSYEPFGRGYIGYRKCKCLPHEDTTYFGSFSDQTFKPTEKIILETFDTGELAIQCEIKLHEFFEVSTNPHFVNRSCQTSTSFSTLGTSRTKEQRQKTSEAISKTFWWKHPDGGSKRSKTCPGEGWIKGRQNKPQNLLSFNASERGKKIQSDAKKGWHWYNNGHRSRLCKTCPGDKWILGRLPYKSKKNGKTV